MYFFTSVHGSFDIHLQQTVDDDDDESLIH